ncbi:hypothetical protein ACX27_30425 [Nostoc piscinale CENA21]|uniref:Uncharacterized protein n=1 Tax=Nostoc piscinale CENA21 TaxID=224013 RepID=A0A0M5MNJ4_9NOSO|nr:DUF3226 domain-containing protein [Nostoc piscinale]ALF56188.1 hypothetical protein ACX27_30425 [Nostoc piscinale CENA21]
MPSISDIPEQLPDTGLIHTIEDGIKFGIWIMPDNQISGMLETFLACLIKYEDESIWQYAQEQKC